MGQRWWKLHVTCMLGPSNDLIFCHGQQNRCTNMTSRTIAVLIVLETKGSFTSRQLICSY